MHKMYTYIKCINKSNKLKQLENVIYKLQLN